MRNAPHTAFFVIAMLLPHLALASESYQAGYRVGHAYGQFIAQFVPYAVLAVAVVAAWLGWRAWKVRRDRKRGGSN